MKEIDPFIVDIFTNLVISHLSMERKCKKQCWQRFQLINSPILKRVKCY